jgi:hypothetical protein
VFFFPCFTSLSSVIADLLAHPALTLSDTCVSWGCTGRVVARLRDLLVGDVGTALLLISAPPLPTYTTQRRPPTRLPHAPVTTSSSTAFLGQPSPPTPRTSSGPGLAGTSCLFFPGGLSWVTSLSFTQPPGLAPGQPHGFPARLRRAGMLQRSRPPARVFRPPLCAPIGGVVRAPRGPCAVVASFPG